MRRPWTRSLLCTWLACSIVVTGCGAPAPRPAPTPVRPAPLAAPAAVPASATGRPEVKLAGNVEGTMTLAFASARPVTDTSAVAPLPADATAALLARLEPLPVLDPAKAPALRAPSPPPPRAGHVQPIAFAMATGTPVTQAPLAKPAATVEAMAAPSILPSGEVRAEAEIRIRFAEAMVPVAKIGMVDAPPARIAPMPAGTWRWIDTRVLGFFAAGARLAQATTYTVTVPAGTRALSGATLATEVTGTFSTKPIALAGAFPAQLRPDSAIAVAFDAAIDPAKILPFLRVQTAAGKRVAMHVVDRAEADRRWARLPALQVRATDLGTHHLLIAPDVAWPAGTELQLVLAKNAPSAEGPLVATKPSYAGVRVVPAFTLRGLACEDEARRTNLRCPAASYMQVEFTNPIALASYRSSKVQILGQPLQDHRPAGDHVPVWAPDVVGKRFEIAIGAGLVDTFGQAYVGPDRIVFTTARHVFHPWLDVQEGFHVIDPRFQIPQWVLAAQAVTQVRVELYRVTPADYFAFEAYEQKDRASPPGTRIYDKTFAIGARHGADLRVDLRPALGAGGTGHVVAIATTTPAKPVDEWFARRTTAWIQVTKLGLAARHDGERISAWAREIAPARFLQPIANATLSVVRAGSRTALATASGDAEGHASLELPEPVSATQHHTPSIVIAEANGDSTFTTFGRDRAQRSQTARWYVTDDRFTYKPGEKVYVKGWLRMSHTGVNPDITAPRAGAQLSWSLHDARRNRIAHGTARLSDQGGFDVEVALPDTANLGVAMFSFSTDKQATSHPISIQEFRTPAYMVTLDDDLQFSGSRPVYAGESIDLRAEAKYFAGGGLPGADIRWDATLKTVAWKPPGWDRYAFDPASERSARASRWRGRDQRVLEAGEASTLSGESTSTVTLAIAETPEHRTSVLEVDATIADLDRMQIRASSNPMLVHPSTYYVGLRQRPNDRYLLDAIVTDVDGTPVPGVAIEIAIEETLGSERFRDDAKITSTQRCTLTSAAAPVPCTWKRKDLQHAYTAVARIADARGRTNSAELEIPWWTDDDTRELRLVPDKQGYRPGDVAKIEIRSKTLPAEATVTIARQGIVRESRVALTKPSTIVELPIEPGFISNVHVVVDRWSASMRTRGGSTLPFPLHVSEQVELPVDIESARLVMTAKPDRPLVEPGAMAGFQVSVRRDDKPVANAEVALLVVDEAILSLSSRKHEDPLAAFYQEYPAGTSLLDTLRLVRDQGLELAGDPGFSRFSLDERVGHGRGTGSGYGYGGGRGGMAGHSTAGPAIVQARKDFRPVAVFAPLLHTDEHGIARVEVKMPDNLTRYRIVALATADLRHFGKAEGLIVAQRLINARTIAPRFLNQGDRFSLPILVQNLATSPREIDVAVRAANLDARGPAGQRVILGAGQRAELRFDFATKARGRAVIQTILVAGAQTDASTLELPVWEPATTESFATYGVVDDKAGFEQLAVPANVFPDVGGVELEVSSTQLQSLTDAYWYLQAYPYECAEQRSGRMLATSAMYDILDAFATPGRPTRDELAAQRATDVAKLAKDQLPSGGFGYFPGMPADPFVSAQVLTALGAAQAPPPVRQKAAAFVTKFVDGELAKLARSAATPEPARKDRDESTYRVSVVTAGLSALAAAGTDVRARVDRVHALATTLGAYPMDAKARVLALVAKQDRARTTRAKLLGELLSATHETASAATVTAQFVEAERLLLVSNTRTTALALDAIMREAPEHTLVTKLARGLLDARASGRWRSTQENLVVLTTMRRYFETYEKVTPNFTSKLWLGKAAYAETTFAGRSSARGTARAGWTELAPGSTHDLALVKDGPGRMYYRVGITYAPVQTNLPPLDAGFVVHRTYTAVDDPRDVTQLPDGRWKIKLGARVLVTVQASTTTRRHAVALVDPLPAGFEAVNEALATAERAVATTGDARWDFKAMRDNRAEVFSMSLREGTHQLSYTARATTPGTFLAAPAKAEEMYSPETFGRSNGVTVVIE